MIRNILAMLLLLVAILVAPTMAQADIIYNNLGVGGTFDQTTGYLLTIIAGHAMPFTVAPGSGFELTQIDLPVESFSVLTSATVELLTNSGSGLPGTVLGTWNLTNLPTFPSPTLDTISGISGIVLGGGATYWLAAFGAGTTAGSDVWLANSTSVTGISAFSGDNGITWILGLQTTLAAFDVIGTSVPEPSSLVLLGTGLLGLGPLWRRRIRSV